MAGAPSLFDGITAPAVHGASRQPGKPPASPLRPDGQFGCAVCGGPAHFGFDVKLRAGKLGRWACRQHIDEVKNGSP